MLITIKYGTKRFSFEGSTKAVPFKFGSRRRRSITGKLRERYVKVINKINLKISELDETLYKELRNAWESIESKQLISEDGVIYNVIFPEEMDTNYSFDYDGKKYYDATFLMEEVQ